MNPAFDFILASARYCLDPVQYAAPVYPVGVEPQEIVKEAVWQRAVGLLYKTAKARPGLLPAPLMNDLRAHYFSQLLLCEPFTRQVQQMLKALRAAGIPVIVFKAWAAFPTVYEGAYGARVFADIDFLIAPEHLRRADAVIVGGGFEPLLEFWPGYRFRHHITGATYVKNISRRENYTIDLHWAIFTRRFYDDRIRVADLFSRAAPLTVAGETTLQLSVEDVILHACGHRSLHHHNVSDLSRYYELVWWIRHTARPVDWPAVLARAGEWKLTTAMQGFVPTVEELFPGTFPAEFLQALRAAVVDPADIKQYDWFVKYAHTPFSIMVPPRWTFSKALDALGLLLEVVFPGPRYLEHRYGATRFLPGNYWKRWMDLTRRMPNEPPAGD